MIDDGEQQNQQADRQKRTDECYISAITLTVPRHIGVDDRNQFQLGLGRGFQIVGFQECGHVGGLRFQIGIWPGQQADEMADCPVTVPRLFVHRQRVEQYVGIRHGAVPEVAGDARYRHTMLTDGQQLPYGRVIARYLSRE